MRQNGYSRYKKKTAKTALKTSRAESYFSLPSCVAAIFGTQAEFVMLYPCALGRVLLGQVHGSIQEPKSQNCNPENNSGRRRALPPIS